MKFRKIFGKKKRNLMDCEIHFKLAEDRVQIFVVKGSRAAILGALSTILHKYCLNTCDSMEEAVDIVKATMETVLEGIKKGKVNQNENS